MGPESVCVVAALVGVANHFGYGPFTVFPQSHHNEPFMPGDRTCSGGAYTFQIPGSLAAQDNVAIPLKVQNAASIRCVYAYLQQGTSDTVARHAKKLLNIQRNVGNSQSPGYIPHQQVGSPVRIPPHQPLRKGRLLSLCPRFSA